MDIIAGGLVGVSQVLIGHPLDTIKILIQNKKKWKCLKIKQFYRGATYPFVSSFLFNATVFPIYNRCYKYTKCHYVSGFIGGFMISPMVHIFDVAKIKRQTNQLINFRTRGLFMSCLRESLAVSIYFGSYEKYKHCGPLISGGLAGVLCWLFTYPIDTVRSRQISQNIKIRKVSRSGLWKGLFPCLLRACAVNSVSFYIYEKIKYL